MLWLAVYLPQLSLEAFCATLPPAAWQEPVALLAEHRIEAVNAVAAQRGVEPGQRRATALALVAELTLGQADPQRNAQALMAVAQAALAFTPAVTLEGADIVLLEVEACLRLFGGLPRLISRLRQALSPLAHRLQIASAPTALGAAVLARWRDGHAQGAHSRDLRALQALLDDAPVWMLGPAREHWEALQGMGLQRLADLRALPRSGLARRFGPGLLDDLDRARGEQADPREWLLLPASYEGRLELFTRADTTEQVLHGASVLLARLVAWAGALKARIVAFTLLMQHEPRHRGEHAEATELAIELATPSADVAHLQLLLRERLARVELLAPTLELRLRCHRVQRSAAPNGELFPTRASEREGLQRLLERLRARLGEQQVCALQPLDDHRPERTSCLVDALSAKPASAASAPMSAPHRPLWLCPEPQALASRDARPVLEGCALQLLVGPERIESGWWDGELAARDYFIAQAEGGVLVWVFRARLPGPAGAPAWFLHGRFG